MAKKNVIFILQNLSSENPKIQKSDNKYACSAVQH